MWLLWHDFDRLKLVGAHMPIGARFSDRAAGNAVLELSLASACAYMLCAF